MKIGGEPDQNFRDICSKVHKQVLFWIRFNLSLPGRICIAKAMMYSQINYLGCFLPLTIGEIQTLSLMIKDFVKGNLKISRKRLLLSREEGGLGLFNLRDFWMHSAAHGLSGPKTKMTTGKEHCMQTATEIYSISEQKI